MNWPLFIYLLFLAIANGYTMSQMEGATEMVVGGVIIGIMWSLLYYGGVFTLL